MRIGLLLCTAFGAFPPDHPAHERRVQQFSNGFRQIAEVAAQYPCYDVFSMDNTVQDPTGIDPRIVAALDSIPNLKQKYHFWDNELGKVNKGGGLIADWTRTLPDLMGQYEFVVHYEPRQHLLNYSFFERVANRPDNYLCMFRDTLSFYGLPITVEWLWTGMFSMRTADLLGYVRAKDRLVRPRVEPLPRWYWRYRDLRWRLLPYWAAGRDEAIEADFLRYIRRHKIPIVWLGDLGAVWHEESRDRLLRMMDCDFRNDELISDTPPPDWKA
jgi:hypothetical protein